MKTGGEMVMDRANGQWRSILQSCGVGQKFLTGKEGPCPFCGGKDRYQWTNHEGKGWYYCRKCGTGDGWEFLAKYHGINKKDALAKIKGVLNIARRDRQKPADDYGRKHIHDLWEGGIAITPYDPAGLYLSSRGIGLKADPLSLRFHPAVSYFEDKKRIGAYPAMIAAFSADDDYTLQITYLTEEGRKRDDVTKAKKMMVGQMPKGGAVKLYGVRETIGVAEGVETALAASRIDQIPVWACLSAQGLGRFSPPPQVKNLVIYGDRDASYTGQMYAYALAHRLVNHPDMDRGPIGVTVRLPDDTGDDWNDVLIGGVT